MTEIKLKRLSLENFKCHKHLKLDFNGRNATICGDNATGKSSVYDALMWLLFAKDSQGNGEKSIEIKPLDRNGEVMDHDALTSVEVVLDVDGEELSLLRTYREKWETKRGSSEAVFTGNTSEYAVDGVPVKRNSFQDKVNELVDEDTFRLLTNTSYFAKDLPWQERRAVLFKVAGVMDDRDILETDERFQPLIDSMGRHSLEDYKRKLLSEKKGFVGAKTEIPARISECQKTIEDFEGMDFQKAKAEADILQAKADGISQRILALENDSASEQKRMEIREAKLELAALENENKAYRQSQMAGNVDTEPMKKRLQQVKDSLISKDLQLSKTEDAIEKYAKAVEACRDNWMKVNNQHFGVGTICPTCGQDLPKEKVQAAIDAAEAEKKAKLMEIEQTANTMKEAKEQAEARLTELQKEILQLEEEKSSTMTKISLAEATKVEPRDMDHYAENAHSINEKITALSGELMAIQQSSAAVRDSLRQEKEDILHLVSQQMAIVSKESLLEYAKKRITELREDAKNAAACLEAIEKMLFLMDEYSRYKTRFVEDSINGLFRVARFRLFREQANGGVEDRCDVVHEGVPYVSVNNGMKINLGIDIINTISQAYGVRVPLFIDNAESVTKLEEAAGQIIRLVVSEQDKELRVNYEN